MIVKEDFIQGRGNIPLFYRLFSLSSSSPTVVIVHGLGEHGGRYAHVRDLFLDLGFSVVLMDNRGHGKSGGRRGHVQDFNYYLQDLFLLWEHLHLWKPLLLGHSLGGLITLRFAQTYPEEISALVVSSPFLGVKMEVPKWKTLFASYLSQIWPTFSLPTGLNPHHLSHDIEAVEKYKRDSLVHQTASARWFTESLKAQEKAFQEVHQLRMPLFFQLAGDDFLCSSKTAEVFFESIPFSQKQMQIYPAFYHEIYNEVEKEKPLQDLEEWVNENVLSIYKDLS